MESETRILPNEILLPEVCSLLAEGKDVILKARGSSMLPFIKGDRDSVKLRRKETVVPGDIALAEVRPGCYVLHRVIKVEGDRVTLMGDGNLRGTERCTSANVKGVAIEIISPDGKVRIPGNGRFWKALTPFRRILLAVIRRVI